MGEPRWEHFEHMADIGVRGIGSTQGEAFEQIALALTAVMTDPATVRPLEKVRIACSAAERELLLADWINALVYEMAVRGMLFGRFAVTLRDGGLEAEAWGEPVDRSGHQPAVEIKGATYTALAFHQDSEGQWIAQLVVDV